MARSPDPGKAAAWQGRLEQFRSSPLTVAQFCAEEGISTASFYHWRKKLHSEPVPRNSTKKRPAFRPVTVTPPAHSISIQLPGGTRIEVPGENLDVVRTVVGELMRAEQPHAGGVSC